MGVYVWNEAYVRRLLADLRQRGFRGRVILGGPQISYAGRGVGVLYPEADCVVRGYGEMALAALVRSGEPLRMPGVAWRDRSDAGEPAEVDLEQLPSPYLTGVLPVLPGARLRWETKRGCPYRCAFCQHGGAVSAARLQRFPVARLRDELALFAMHEASGIDILDPIFNIGPDYLWILRELARQSARPRVSLQARFELVCPDFLDLLRDSDAHPEFGLQTIHEAEAAAIHRTTSLGSVERAMDELRRRGVSYTVTLIYGLPQQTLASFRETVQFCLERHVPVVRAYPLSLLRGTVLEKERERWGLATSAGAIPRVVRSNTFDEADHARMERIAHGLAVTEERHPRRVEDLEPSVFG